MAKLPTGVINSQEAYSKNEVMNRLGIGQRFWDQMLDNGLPYANIGHSRWVTGQSLIDYMTTHAVLKSNDNAAATSEATEGGSDGTES